MERGFDANLMEPTAHREILGLPDHNYVTKIGGLESLIIIATFLEPPVVNRLGL